MIYFVLFVLYLVTQRMIELYIAHRNESWMKKKGAYEIGGGHYKYIVAIHTLFFVVYFFEVFIKGVQISSAFKVILCFFVLTQLLRLWVIKSLGKYWNTKIIILPNEEIVKKGPYKYLRHPNYVIVALELVLIPLLYNAYITAVVFTLLNIFVLSIRIPTEERALSSLTNYKDHFSEKNRFVPQPKLLKRE
ncbi:isoprenylcysteine carboxyl methyltransferase family protein [Litchfieldia alkalitelluris]|uniref:isoprenylcysteine carboxyl methyltransferase family protein n=1 Tax=Litchfieldia alkalitelluris TaxID=304268 RepID=UPI002E25CA69|nr:isoprenylcysteine carboxylmethyltransferase family protein [Litchfieldia alkalitelluris]